MADIQVLGTPQERKVFTDVIRHYEMATEDLDIRRKDFDKKDILFRSHIEQSTWPYNAMVFAPIIFTALYEKTARSFANKPAGRMIPREGGDSLGAHINNELSMFQWDENERVDNISMLAKWALMYLNAKKYGSSFGLAKWHYQRELRDKKPYVFYNGPQFRPLDNRDCLPNPSYATVKNWFQHRDYLTLQELKNVNDSALTAPVYKNLDLLAQQIKKDQAKGGDTREANYISKNKSIKGLTDFLGRDEVFRVVEVITEYRNDRWITFSPKHGVVLRDIPNPYDHGQIPVVHLKFHAVDDDLYGVSDIEPVEKLQRALNAYLCQNLDTLNMSTYTPLKINQTGGAVQMHTLEFGPGKKWLMTNPQTDVLPYESNPQGITEFVPVYRLIYSAIQEALGETSVGTSNLDPSSPDKTATEIRDSAVQRSARDNFDQIFLGEAMKKQMMFWFKMNQQFLFSNQTGQQKVIRIVGKDSISYFERMGLDGQGMSDESMETLENPESVGMLTPEDMLEPMYPVEVNGEMIPKMVMEEDGSSASLIVEKEDLAGNYDYIPDVQSMRLPNEQQILTLQQQLLELAMNPVTSQLLVQEQYKLKFKELLEDTFEQLGIKDADKYFEKLSVQPMMNGQVAGTQANPAGAGGIGSGQQGMANGGNGGIQAGMQALSPQ